MIELGLVYTKRQRLIWSVNIYACNLYLINLGLLQIFGVTRMVSQKIFKQFNQGDVIPQETFNDCSIDADAQCKRTIGHSFENFMQKFLIVLQDYLVISLERLVKIGIM